MKIVMPGGSGQVGAMLVRALRAKRHEIIVLSRDEHASVRWDGRTLGAWARELDGADVVINLAGRSVNCRYTPSNLDQMMRSRVDSTVIVGRAIEQAARPPRVWLQMSTATIYAHRFDAPNDERTGRIGGDEPDVPRYWDFSVQIAKAWEEALQQANTPATRKVALRTAMVMSPDRGGVFDILHGLARAGAGGAIAGGAQYMSWIHEHDYTRAVQHLIERDDLSGAINITAPNPLPQRDFMAALRRACGTPFGLPVTKWMAELGAFVLRSDSELTLKSRRVVPTRLLEADFVFDYPSWPEAAAELCQRRKGAKQQGVL